MDGQSMHPTTTRLKTVRAAAALVALMAVGLGSPATAVAQAMGKAIVDPGAAALTPAAPPVASPAAPTPAPALDIQLRTPTTVPLQTAEAAKAGEPVSAAREAFAASVEKPAEKTVEKSAERVASGSVDLVAPSGPPAPAFSDAAKSVDNAVPASPTAEPRPEPKPAAVAAEPAPHAATAPSITASAIEQEPIRLHAGVTAKAGESNLAAGAAPASQPAAGLNLPSGLNNLGQVAAALAIVIGLIFVGKAAVRKFVPGANTPAGKGVIEILARHPLSKNQALVLVRIGSQIVALSQGKDASESVLVISDAAEVAKIIGQIEGKNPASSQAGFTRLLANARIDLEREGDQEPEVRDMPAETLDEQLDEMAAAKRQLMELRQHVRSVRDSLPRT